jgi:radical SAM superfamily enzyme YgiQ (UPF0313 family)
MKVALVFPPLYGVDMPPLGIAYIAARLVARGDDVKIFCFNSRLHAEHRDKQHLWGWDQSHQWCSADRINGHFDVAELIETWTDEILDIKPDIVGFSVNTHSRVLSNLLADKLKARKKTVHTIFGGPWCTELIGKGELNKNVDVYVRGEGEGIVSTLIDELSARGRLHDCTIAGTIVNTGDDFQDNGWNAAPLDIDSLPFPALHLFNLDHYTNKEEIPIIFSRGCNYQCKFCTDKPMWGNYRMRAARNIVEEMKRHSGLFGRKRFKCNDLMVNGDLVKLSAMSDRIIQDNLDFEWGSMARARSDMTEDTFRSLKKAGCIYLTYGIESGASKVLAHMGKPAKKTIAQALRFTHRSGIKVNTLWMVGYPVESWLDVLETMLFLFNHRKDIDEFVSVSPCYIPRQSWLGKQQDALRIAYNDKSEWYIPGVSTPPMRESRRRRLLFFARVLGLYKGGI